MEFNLHSNYSAKNYVWNSCWKFNKRRPSNMCYRCHSWFQINVKFLENLWNLFQVHFKIKNLKDWASTNDITFGRFLILHKTSEISIFRETKVWEGEHKALICETAIQKKSYHNFEKNLGNFLQGFLYFPSLQNKSKETNSQLFFGYVKKKLSDISVMFYYKLAQFIVSVFLQTKYLSV